MFHQNLSPAVPSTQWSSKSCNSPISATRLLMPNLKTRSRRKAGLSNIFKKREFKPKLYPKSNNSSRLNKLSNLNHKTNKYPPSHIQQLIIVAVLPL